MAAYSIIRVLLLVVWSSQRLWSWSNSIQQHTWSSSVFKQNFCIRISRWVHDIIFHSLRQHHQQNLPITKTYQSASFIMDKLAENAKGSYIVSKANRMSVQITEIITFLVSSLGEMLSSYCRSPTYVYSTKRATCCNQGNIAQLIFIHRKWSPAVAEFFSKL